MSIHLGIFVRIQFLIEEGAQRFERWAVIATHVGESLGLIVIGSVRHALSCIIKFHQALKWRHYYERA